MEQSKIFGIINKINSILFLVLLAGGCFLIILGIISSNRWQDRRAVEVVQNDTGEKQEKIELVLGDIANIPGYETQYVRLRSRESGGSFSSGYSGGREIRNVLFFTGKELTTHWLYKNHTFVINQFSTLTRGFENKEKALAIYIKSIKSDSNGDKSLDEDDLLTISLTDPYGKNYTEINTDVQSVIDYNVVEDGQYLILLLQKNNKVILQKYSLSSFKLVSEKVINEITKKL